MSWQSIPAPEGKIQVFLAAIPCKTADALLKMLHQAGLKPYLMDLKPLAMARVVKEETAVIIDVQPTEFDIVIMANGVPQPVRTLPLPSEALSWQDKLPAIRNDLNRTIEFYNSNNPENPLVSDVPVFVCGELANEPELCQSLSGEIGHPVLPLSSPLKCAEGLDPNRYMVNIGLALKELPSGEAGPLVTNLNVLPIPYRPKPTSLTNILAPPGAVIAIGLLFFVAMLIQNSSADIASMRGQLNTTSQLIQQKVAQRQELMGNIAGLEKKIAEAEASSGNFTVALGSLDRQDNMVNGDLEIMINTLPDTLSLTSISHADSILTINGRAPGEVEVLSYLRSLDTSGRFSEITFTGTTRTEGGGIDFTAALRSLDRQNNGDNGNLAVILSSLPSTLILSSISHDNGMLTIDGRAPGEVEVLSYLRSLDASGRFSEITLTNMKRIEGEGVDFTVALRTGGQG